MSLVLILIEFAFVLSPIWGPPVLLWWLGKRLWIRMTETDAQRLIRKRFAAIRKESPWQWQHGLNRFYNELNDLKPRTRQIGWALQKLELFLWKKDGSEGLFKMRTQELNFIQWQIQNELFKGVEYRWKWSNLIRK